MGRSRAVHVAIGLRGWARGHRPLSAPEIPGAEPGIGAARGRTQTLTAPMSRII